MTAGYLSQTNRLFPPDFPAKILYAFVISNCLIFISHQNSVCIFSFWTAWFVFPTKILYAFFHFELLDLYFPPKFCMHFFILNGLICIPHQNSVCIFHFQLLDLYSPPKFCMHLSFRTAWFVFPTKILYAFLIFNCLICIPHQNSVCICHFELLDMYSPPNSIRVINFRQVRWADHAARYSLHGAESFLSG